ncbi:oxidoreductase [Actinomadura sp. NBRC 104412]|nr:oxidoreductase [Actinomadura sp. NBRC 104412]
MAVPGVKLNNGITMPQLGLGVWLVPEEDTENVVRTALDIGYRSIDTASAYENEEGTGRALRASGIPREELFVTTKLRNGDQGYDSTLRAFDTSMRLLGLDYLDLYLIHWPMPSRDTYMDTWRAFEKLLEGGRVRSIGVSNFTAGTLRRVIDEGDVVPAVNQIELHPYFQQADMRAVNSEHDVRTEAYSPLGHGGKLLRDPVLTSLAEKYDRTPAQIALRWHIQLGNIVIPKSVTPSRIAENCDVFGFELADDDMAAIRTMDRGARVGEDPETFDLIF